MMGIVIVCNRNSPKIQEDFRVVKGYIGEKCGEKQCHNMVIIADHVYNLPIIGESLCWELGHHL